MNTETINTPQQVNADSPMDFRPGDIIKFNDELSSTLIRSSRERLYVKRIIGRDTDKPINEQFDYYADYPTVCVRTEWTLRGLVFVVESANQHQIVLKLKR